MSYTAKWASLYAPLCCIWYTQTEQVSFGFKLRLSTLQLRRCNGGKTSLVVAEKKKTSDRRCNHCTSGRSACASHLRVPIEMGMDRLLDENALGLAATPHNSSSTCRCW